MVKDPPLIEALLELPAFKETMVRDLAAANARIRELEATAMAYAKERDRAMEANALAVDELQRLQGLEDVARRYVAACLAIREAPYPSEAFTAAVAHAGACYHALLEAYP